MHINYHRGETRELAWRNRPNHTLRHYGQNWRRACAKFKHERAARELEEPRHRRSRKGRQKPFRLNAGTGWWHRRYTSEKAAQQAVEQLRKGTWSDLCLRVERVA